MSNIISPKVTKPPILFQNTSAQLTNWPNMAPINQWWSEDDGGPRSHEVWHSSSLWPFYTSLFLRIRAYVWEFYQPLQFNWRDWNSTKNTLHFLMSSVSNNNERWTTTDSYGLLLRWIASCSHTMSPPSFPLKIPPWSDSICSPPLCAWAQLRFPPAGAGARGRHHQPAAASELASHIDGSTAREKSFPWGGGRGADVRRSWPSKPIWDQSSANNLFSHRSTTYSATTTFNKM